MNDNYSAPNAELETQKGRSIESGITGDYDFEIGKNLSEAWSGTKGIKRYILGAGALMYVALIAIMVIVGVVIGVVFGGFGAMGGSPGIGMILTQLAIQLLTMAIIFPFVGGIMMMGIKHIQHQEVAFSDLFSCFNKTGALIITAILMNIMIIIGFLLFVIPGIYLSVAYLLAFPLIVDRNISPWEALEASRKAISKRWFSVFFWYIALMIIVIISIIPLGLGLIWTMPMMVMAIIILYRDIFGIMSTEQASS